MFRMCDLRDCDLAVSVDHIPSNVLREMVGELGLEVGDLFHENGMILVDQDHAFGELWVVRRPGS